jgi:hypothetical protein
MRDILSPDRVTRVPRWWKRNCDSRPACHNIGGHARMDQGVVGVMREGSKGLGVLNMPVCFRKGARLESCKACQGACRGARGEF